MIQCDFVILCQIKLCQQNITFDYVKETLNKAKFTTIGIEKNWKLKPKILEISIEKRFEICTLRGEEY